MSSKENKTRVDIYAKITDRIVADLEKGVRPWVKPWNAANTGGRITRPLRHNGLPYQGINTLLLWSEAVSRGFVSPIWMTFKQSIELGGHVRKGETGATVVYASRFTRTETDAHGEEVERGIPFLKAYTVFSADQIDGLPEQYYLDPAPATDPVERIAHADTFFANTGAVIRHGGNQAYFNPGLDIVQMPPFESFRDAPSYCDPRT
ncbi:antirestriction protein ArdC [Rhizobium binae]|uniref:Antirestriction protein ArdC n=1 Tax=Rhizobium binae TaxID=1138190 RepID=A0ABV2MKU6_9HYPH